MVLRPGALQSSSFRGPSPSAGRGASGRSWITCANRAAWPPATNSRHKECHHAGQVPPL